VLEFSLGGISGADDDEDSDGSFEEEGSHGGGGGGFFLVIVPDGGGGGGLWMPRPAGGLSNTIAPGAIEVGNTPDDPDPIEWFECEVGNLSCGGNEKWLDSGYDVVESGEAGGRRPDGVLRINPVGVWSGVSPEKAGLIRPESPIYFGKCPGLISIIPKCDSSGECCRLESAARVEGDFGDFIADGALFGVDGVFAWWTLIPGDFKASNGYFGFPWYGSPSFGSSFWDKL
jgi:hypothetical protein